MGELQSSPIFYVHCKDVYKNKKEENFFQSSLLRGATGIRTRDTRIFSPLLYQLSYGTIIYLPNLG